ncbi:MAG: hypothetical protein V4547_01040 [Bacteroidota bacterium]
MRKEIKKYLSFVLLFLFLFPMVEKEIHAFEHSMDEHCASSDFHFHDQEHDCAICDFTILDSNAKSTIDYQLITSVYPLLFQNCTESIYSNTLFQHLPSRAPPLV